ncbi:MAG: hypothetical protein PHO20_00475 [Candidatus Peribacteraceae bacterium]|nr:hypothetical protein [Candidatus Peribacteraceae bacterium]MDD5739228.1 hypothetical protein [Candidatus Peribacteraceae bacterium]
MAEHIDTMNGQSPQLTPESESIKNTGDRITAALQEISGRIVDARTLDLQRFGWQPAQDEVDDDVSLNNRQMCDTIGLPHDQDDLQW